MSSRTATSLKQAAAAILAGALLACGFPPLGWPVLLPAGVALLVRAVELAASVRHAALYGLLAGLSFYGITLPWLFTLFGPSALSLLFISAAFPMLFAAGYRALRRRYIHIPAWLLGGLLWAGIEYLRSELFWLSFGWMGLGYGLVGNPLFAAAASGMGSYGISFVVAALGTALATNPLRQPARAMLNASLIFFWLAVNIVPVLTPHTPPMPNNPMSVRLVQSRAGEPEEAIRLSTSRNAVTVDVILWPEYSILSDPQRDSRLWEQLRALARSQQSHLVFGAKESMGEGDAYRNTAFVLDPRGELIGRHYKNHTVHLMSDGIPGKDATPIRSELGSLGIAICYDLDYPDVARKLVQKGASVLLVPNMDPDEWGDLQREQHRLMFRMRAVECGRWLARADVAGGTSVVAPDGSEVETIGTSEPRAMEVIVGREQGRTLYIRGGWLFGPVCFWVSVALVLFGLIRRGTTREKAAASTTAGPPVH